MEATEDPEQDKQVAIIIFVMAIAGMCVNLFVLIFIQQIDSIRKPFVQTSVSQMIADFTVLFTFAAYAAPRTFFNDMEVLKNTTLNRFMGQLNITAYVACIYTHLLRSTCRFMAISLPIRHSRIFTQRNTIAALFLVWLFAALQTLIHFFGGFSEGCAFTYVVDQYGFMYSDTTCGMAIKLVIDFAQYLIVILFV
ncbi:unnamed protein product, partial [Anisakis simplex]|uniref:G_PROTEIN_RECEP_F1_2 domain-containing protein n=1 Tax=Anisakis simplex TaxID=6269 RepID=A0A0M3J311_ANISI